MDFKEHLMMGGYALVGPLLQSLVPSVGESLWRRRIDLPGARQPLRNTQGFLRRFPTVRRRYPWLLFHLGMFAVALPLAIMIRVAGPGGTFQDMAKPLCLFAFGLGVIAHCYTLALMGQRSAQRSHLRERRRQRRIARRIRRGTTVSVALAPPEVLPVALQAPVEVRQPVAVRESYEPAI